MDAKQIENRLAVCSWSLQPANPASLIEAIQHIEIPRVQLALSPMVNKATDWENTAAQLEAAGIEIVSGMMETKGEDYSSMETIKKTGGIVPDEHWDHNRDHAIQLAMVAKDLGLKLVTFHAGFLPHSPEDPGYQKLKDRVEIVAEIFADQGLDLGFETGQETADSLAAFLSGLKCENVGVNFDPANMILYDKGEPIPALKTLAPWLKQVHIKDANRTATPGEWGSEVATGTGQVDWTAFLDTLASLGYSGDMAIEREAGDQRIVDIKAAKTHLLSL